jgi:hypothetical protein
MMVITERAMAHPAYRQTLDLATELASKRIRVALDGKNELEQVNALRALGGTSKIITEAVEEAITLVPEVNTFIGSQMIPMVVADVVRVNYKVEIGNKVRLWRK